MTSIDFFTPVTYKTQTKTISEQALEAVEEYFYLGNRFRVTILPPDAEHPHRRAVQNRKDCDRSWANIALKIASYYTLILPLIALLAKAVLRHHLQISSIQVQPQNSSPKPPVAPPAPNPPIPKKPSEGQDLPPLAPSIPGDYPVDQQAVRCYISDFAPWPQYQAVLQKAIDNIQYISFKTFEKGLNECLEKLKPLLKDQPYAVGISSGKSNEWVWQLAELHLPTPERTFPLENKTSCSVKVATREETNLSFIQEKTIVLFDDVSYSGKQIIGHVCAIRDHFKQKGETGIHLIVVIPFMSKKARTDLEDPTYFHPTIKISCLTTETQIKQLDEIFNAEELSQLQKPPSDLEPDLRENLSFNRNQTLCYTAWRYPDGTSFPDGFGRKVTMLQKTKEIDIYRILKKPDTSRRFIPLIPRVYGVREQDVYDAID